MKYYDLNIKKILREWTIANALREIISNAIDESKISKTKEPVIKKENGKWTITDFGRGIKISNFSQDENKEKLNMENVIGKFGIGLKDAIAVLNRLKIEFIILTKSFKAYPVLKNKEGFDEETIHIAIEENANPLLEGTKFVFENIKDEDIAKAKNNFLIFQDVQNLFKNEFGQIIEKKSKSKIYVNGMQVSEDDDYTFSYNITKINKKLASKMNRERKSLGRDAYSDSIEKIVSEDMPKEVIDRFIDNEEISGEMTKKSIRKFVFAAMNKSGKFVFMTKEQIQDLTSAKKEAIENAGKEIKEIKNVDNDFIGEDGLSGWDTFVEEHNKNFEYEEALEQELTSQEKNSLEKAKKVMKALDSQKEVIPIKNHNCIDADIFGVWVEQKPNTLFLQKSILKDWKQTLIALIHEWAHSLHGLEDMTREFENDLGEAWYKHSQLIEV